ncbi:MAG: response regulator [Candidatus Rokubacteria bacterium]|nr:response regulator [Candidatus Rokubacteria bacterium]
MDADAVNVLVVEDDRDHAELIARTLASHHPPFRVTVARDGLTCLDAVARERFSVILLDYSLPGMDGLAVLPRLRDQAPDVPVVMITGRGDERVAVEAMNAGGADYIVKTSGYLAALPTVLRKVLKQHELALENARLYREAQHALAELKTAQDHLVRVETLRALGELAGGVAHHLNNLLTVIVARIDLLRLKPEAEPFRRSLTIVNRAAKDGAEVVRRIQEFARVDRVCEPQLVDLNELTSDVIEMTRVRWHDAARAQGLTIEVERKAGPIPLVAGHAASLREVITNLVLNAVDALPRGGRITVRTAREDDEVCLSVTDDGVGMPEAVARRALEPFFTTKGLKSTGLGLSVSHSVLQRHGGGLHIESAEGRGTTVTMRLPVSPEQRDRDGASSSSITEIRPLRILLVDDEAEVRESIGELLEFRGHHVALAGGAREALRRLETEALPDVVLTDLGMPEMTGWDLAAAIRRRWTRLPVGLVTGWGDEPAPDPARAGLVDFVLSKPLTLEAVYEQFLRLEQRGRLPELPCASSSR